ncbi:hypothetical protein GCM10010112_58420 [Actinoplanes lobatus]|uniref:Uncharacterized protein n=1 Tax=Actinoplanes lobatus TaxID=113568 RepID=A0A7W7HQU4_9ACTN|nr:hypothetical protein [Actinoplanes lobatus]MBB4754807.1 hypothetical protein [Actinoplanes lobatus]GGN81707.1 hypothetical protein GCM10010112_58420 [Actinoplanes lobatus]GIE43062.1 hypothetical protein Alo02nite_59600 [Actinoplanes lobatus]
MTSAPYGLSRPTLDDARAAVLRVHAGDGARIWNDLLRTAGLTGNEPAGLDRMLAVMHDADPSTRLCAVAVKIRVTAYTQLAAAHSIL